jgi:hypothetical protein
MIFSVDMKKISILYSIIGIAIIIVVATLLMTAFEEKEPATFCNLPYFEFQAKKCCLDVNSNSICDNEEQPKQEPKIEAKAEEKKEVTVVIEDQEEEKQATQEVKTTSRKSIKSFFESLEHGYLITIPYKASRTEKEANEKIKEFLFKKYKVSPIERTTYFVKEKPEQKEILLGTPCTNELIHKYVQVDCTEWNLAERHDYEIFLEDNKLIIAYQSGFGLRKLLLFFDPTRSLYQDFEQEYLSGNVN